MTSDKAYATEQRLNTLVSTMQLVSPRNQTISSTTGQNITGLSYAVVAGTYVVRGSLVVEWNSNASQPFLIFTGPAVSQFDVSFKSQQSGTTTVTNGANLVSAASGNGTGYNTTAIAVTVAQTGAGIFFDVDFWGIFTFTAAGTLTLQAATAPGPNTWIALSGFWQVW